MVRELGHPVRSRACSCPRTYLAFNGCTNFGGYIWLAVAVDVVLVGCRRAGRGHRRARVLGGARTPSRRAVSRRTRSGKPLSAAEAKQVFRAGGRRHRLLDAEAAVRAAQQLRHDAAASTRYVTTAGWDQITGCGRMQRQRRRAPRRRAARIPPEADITSPRWWQPLPASGLVEVDRPRRRAARRPRSPTRCRSRPACSRRAGRRPRRGRPSGRAARAPADRRHARHARPAATCATLIARGTARVHAARRPDVARPARAATPSACASSSRDDRADTPDAIEQRQAFAYRRPRPAARLPTLPRRRRRGHRRPSRTSTATASTSSCSPTATASSTRSDADGTEAAGLARAHQSPTRCRPPATTATPAASCQQRRRAAPSLLGSTAIADLDGDGRPEVAVADLEGTLNVFDHTRPPVGPASPCTQARLLRRARMSNGPRPACDDHSAVDARDEIEHGRLTASRASPSIGDLDQAHPGLELVAGANDGHVYAWHADGSPVPGWPVLAPRPGQGRGRRSRHAPRRPSSTARASSFGRKVVSPPSLGDVDGDGDLEVAVNVNEEYEETPNASTFRDPVVAVLGSGARSQRPGNTRTYLLHHDGTAHAASRRAARQRQPSTTRPTWPGWPVPIAMISARAPAVRRRGLERQRRCWPTSTATATLEIATASIAGPPYLLRRRRLDLPSATVPTDYADRDGEPTRPSSRAVATDGPTYRLARRRSRSAGSARPGRRRRSSWARPGCGACST